MSSANRQTEYAKYEKAYQGIYGMGKKRKRSACEAIESLSVNLPATFLDIGCGRGEVLTFAEEKGYDVQGVDVVVLRDKVTYGEAHCLPFEQAFDVVTCFDVLEHLIPDDTIPALKEIRRLYKRACIITAANYPSLVNGEDLHINKRSYEEWDQLINQYVGKAEINRKDQSAMWIIHA